MIQQKWFDFKQIERIQTKYGQKVILRMGNGDMLPLPARYGALSDKDLQEINQTDSKQFRILEKKLLENGNYTFIYEFLSDC